MENETKGPATSKVKRKPGRPKKGDEDPKIPQRKTARRKMVLKRDNERIVQDVIKSLAGRKEDLTVEVYMCDPITLLLLPKLVTSLSSNSLILFTDPDDNQSTVMNRTIHGLSNTLDRVEFLHPSQMGIGYGEILIFGETDSVKKFLKMRKNDYNYEDHYSEIIVAEEF
jgi:hypothetical protein